MRRVLYNRAGEPGHYLTGAGVVFDLQNAPVGTVQDVQVLNRNGEVVGWFDGAFAWDALGVLAFVKGAVSQGGLALPKTAPLRARLEPTPAPFHPLLRSAEPPPLLWRWSEHTLADVLTCSLVG